MDIQKYHDEAVEVMNEVKKTIIGKDDCIQKVMMAIIAGGHILIDDIPGVGKTSLAMAFARAMNLDNRRMQFTSDVMPSDILGFSMYNKKEDEFQYQEGTIMCNIFLADEINRTSPKTQSALLEVMEENKVTVDGVTRSVPEPFIVIATENPIGSVGTQLLPESQLDRFMICITMGYPSLENEIAIAKGTGNAEIVENVNSIIDGEELIRIQQCVQKIHISDKLYTYICTLVHETRNQPMIELGVSPRGTIALVNMVKAAAFLDNRDYAVPDDVIKVFGSVAAHRLVLSAKARVNNTDAETLLQEIIQRVKKPGVRDR